MLDTEAGNCGTVTSRFVLQQSCYRSTASICVCIYVEVLRVHCRYAYILYNDVDKAKSVVEEYSEDPPIFYARVLDVKFYREPVAQIPKGRLSAVLTLIHVVILFRH